MRNSGLVVRAARRRGWMVPATHRLAQDAERGMVALLDLTRAAGRPIQAEDLASTSTLGRGQIEPDKEH